MEIETSPISENESYTKGQKLIGNMLPLLPKNIKTKVESNKAALLEGLKAIVDYIKSHPLTNDMNNLAKESETKDLYQSILEGLWITFNLVNNFKINVKENLFKEIFLFGLKTLERPKVNLLISIKIVKVLRKFPIFYLDLEHLTEYAHKKQLWIQFFDIIHEEGSLAEESKVGKGNYKIYKTELKGLLKKGFNQIFAMDFEEIYEMMRLEKIPFFGLPISSSNVQMMSIMIPLGHIGKGDLAVVMREFRFVVDNVVKNSKFIILVRKS